MVEDAPGVSYYSIGAKKIGKPSSLLGGSQKIVSDGNDLLLQNDGLMLPEQAEWGDYLITIDSDHLELAGFNY